MTREEAQLILQHIDIVEHYANGGDLEFKVTNYRKEFLGWRDERASMKVNCLAFYRKKIKLTLKKDLICTRLCCECRKGMK